MKKSDKVNVLLCSPVGIPGGIPIWTENILSAWEKTDNSGIGITQFFPTKFTHSSVSRHGSIARIWAGLRSYLPFIKGLRKKLKSEQFDVVHLSSSAGFGLLRDLIALCICKSYGVKSVVHFHFGRIPSLAKSRNWEWNLLTKVISRASATIVMDPASLQALKLDGFDSVVNLPNPLSERVINMIDAVGDKRRMKGVVLFVGHVIPTKGVFELVEACKSIPDIKLKIVSICDPELQKQLQYLAGENHQTWLEFTGNIPQSEVLSEMCHCDVFALPTYTEGFPNVIIEAMAAGCAIVTTPVGAIPEILENYQDKRFGLFVQPRSVTQLHDAIVELLANESLKSELRKNVSVRVHERYHIQNIWNSLAELWIKTTQNPVQ